MAVVRKKALAGNPGPAVKKKVFGKAAKAVKKGDTAGAVDADSYKLPVAKSKPMTRFEDFSWLLYGAKKIGKTTLMSLFGEQGDGDVMFIMAEPGTKALSVFGGDYIHSSWSTIVAAIKQLKKDTRFRHVVLDPIDLIAKLCEQHVCARMGISHPSEEEWGKGWNAVRDEFTKWIAALMATGKGVTFISHMTEREIKRRDGSKYDRIQPTMGGMARDVIESFVDVWAYYDYEGDYRMLTIKGDENTLAGNRLQNNFKWKGKEVTQVLMSPTKEAGFKNLIDAFNNRYDHEAALRALDGADEKPAAAPVVKKKKA